MSGGGTLSPGIGTHWDASSRWPGPRHPERRGRQLGWGLIPQRRPVAQVQCSCRFLMSVGWLRLALTAPEMSEIWGMATRVPRQDDTTACKAGENLGSKLCAVEERKKQSLVRRAWQRPGTL